MTNTQTAVFWRGKLIGFIDLARIDMFHIYGQWRPGDAEVVEEFLWSLTTIEQSVELGYQVPRIKGIIFDPPDQQIDIRLDIELNDHNPITKDDRT